MKLRFLGCGDAFGSGGRLNTCFHVDAPAGGFLIDCGASAMVSLRRFGVNPNAIRTVFVSHLHGDHFGGLPFFILDGQFYSKRQTPLTVAGPPGTRQRLHDAMEVLFPGSATAQRKFAVDVVELVAGARTEVQGVIVTPYEVAHFCGSPPFTLRFEYGGKILAYTGDTEWSDGIIATGRHADILIAEALFYDRQAKFHLDFATLMSKIDAFAPKRLILTHLGPDMLAHRSELPQDILVAEDGLDVEL